MTDRQLTDEISDDVKRAAATIWMNRALAAEAEVERLRAELNRAMREIVDLRMPPR